MVVLDNICSTLGNLHWFIIAVVWFCPGAHCQIVGEGLRRHIAVETLLPAASMLSHLTLLGLDHHWQGQRLATSFGFHAQAGQLSPPDWLSINPQKFILGADWSSTNQLRTFYWVNFLRFCHAIIMCIGKYCVNIYPKSSVGGRNRFPLQMPIFSLDMCPSVETLLQEPTKITLPSSSICVPWMLFWSIFAFCQKFGILKHLRWFVVNLPLSRFTHFLCKMFAPKISCLAQRQSKQFWIW